MTINVGLGTGGKTEQLAHLMSLIGLQKEALAAGKGNLVSDDNLYNSAREFTRLVGLKNVERFFTDPRTQAPPQAAPNPALIEMQLKGEIEKTQAQADIATQQKKVESEMALAQQRFELEKQLRLLDAQLKVEEHRRKRHHRCGEGGGRRQCRRPADRRRQQRSPDRRADGITATDVRSQARAQAARRQLGNGVRAGR
jgi:hypothetical protein